LRAVLRPLLLLLIALTVLLAIVTTSGRVLIAWLPRLESHINTILIPRGVELEGLRGAWHLLNPVIRVDHLRFAGGDASDVTMEVDVLESAFYSGLVLRHLSAARVELAPVHDVDGHWRLGKSGGAGGGVPFEALLRYSDGLRLPDVHIRFSAAEVRDGVESLVPLGEMHLHVAVANAGLRHSGEFVVDVEQGGVGEIRLAYNLSDALFGRPTNGQIAVDAEQFVIDPTLGLALAGIGGNIDQLHGHWSFADRTSTGRLTLDAKKIELSSGGLDAVNLLARGSVDRLGLRWELVLDRLAVTSAHGSAILDDTVVAYENGLDGTRNIEVALPPFDAAPVIGVVRAAAANIRGVDEWLGALAPRGRIDGARARFDVNDRELSYAANVSNIALENAKGVPYVRNARATVAGTEHSVLISLAGEQVTLGFLNFFDQPTQLDHLSGDLLIWFAPDHLAVQGRDLAATFAASSVHGEFSFGRPSDPLEQRLLMRLRLSDIDGRAALAYVPRALPQALLHGLDRAVVGGYVDVADIVYHGHLRTLPGLPMRQVELNVELHDGIVRFHPDWPPAAGVAGRVKYTASGTTGEFHAGNLVGIEAANATVFLPNSQEYVSYEGKGAGDGTALRGLIDGSPLSTRLKFVKPEWSFSGPFDYTTQMKIPITGTFAPIVDLQFKLGGLTAQLADMKLELQSLRGKLQYHYPTDVETEALDGMIFGRPAHFVVNSDEGQIRIGFDGRTAVQDVTQWRGWANPGVAGGEFDFAGEYRIRPGSNETPVLALRSDLVGVALELPSPLGKQAQDAMPSSMNMEFSAEGDRLDVRLGQVAQGWLRIIDGGIRAGSIGIGVDPGLERGDEDAVTINGGISQLDLTDRFRGEVAGLNPNFPWGMNAFEIGRVTYRNIAFDGIVADVSNRGGELRVSITGPAIEGSMKWVAPAPPKIDLHYVKLPGAKPGGGVDPLANVDPRGIGDLDIAVQNVSLAEEDFGSWRFRLRRSDLGVAIDDLVADIRGVHIESLGNTLWSTADGGRTYFNGSLRADNLATVLPLWGYAPSLETTSTEVGVDISWPGSPLNFALPRIVGQISVKAENGRFVDLGEGSGAVRIFSLLNFTAIAKRMTLDFSDVFGKGISFDEIKGVVMTDQGVINFVEPMEIEGTGGDFRINGTVNLLTGALDNEMVVTLPVSSSLPWYAAYLGFVNPLAAGAVLVGERIFRSQIDKFSSAKYKIGGTLQNPEVDFEQVFPKAMAEPTETAAAQSTPVQGATPGETPRVVPGQEAAQPESNVSGAAPDAAAPEQPQPKDKDA